MYRLPSGSATTLAPVVLVVGLVLLRTADCAVPLPAIPCPSSRCGSRANGSAGEDDAMPDEELDLDVGRWREFRTHRFDEDLSGTQRKRLENLESLRYAAGSTTGGLVSGVLRYDQDRAQPGLNLFCSGHGPEAFLIDMEGNLVHRWECALWEIWPDYPVRKDLIMTEYLRRVYLRKHGNLLVIFDGLGLVKLDRNSRVLWASPCRAHHDLDFAENGDIYVLTREAKIPAWGDHVRPVTEDFVSILGPDGVVKRRVSIVKALDRSRYRSLWDPSATGDLSTPTRSNCSRKSSRTWPPRSAPAASCSRS
jgi:hypothetical protein